MRVLLIEDDDRVAGALSVNLTRQRMDVDRVGSAQRALERLRTGARHDVVLLDLGLPDLDGLALCKRIRELCDVPVIMVTARTDMSTRLHGLHVGADDYVTKPFDPRELVARIHAVTRRASRTAPPESPVDETPAPASSTIAGPGGVRIDVERREVTVDGEAVPLTRKEFNLLAMLARQPGIVFTRSRILAEVWDSAWVGNQRTLEVHVAAVRAKLGVAGVIETVRGVGYRFPAG
ncbi:response regulator transcription factor [Cryptosporangium aurantiacum]|uniref:Sensory transduction protein RegX3 n=1 Tax=Cryptosporangium aurantiacum TaxID=134849 RepID=A0A1M7IWG5_9ACTN|nr:response regulator transcription factor [Cryptosporangium aurantiacum]SHM44983.1 DNA-binding response regulator, OmpR family, contains REC and winged-helix (wHTH) domain [Cryptosporangium aurantiacum]